MQFAPSSPIEPGDRQQTQELLDGLPIAAAVIGRTGANLPEIVRANDSFRALAGHDERLRGPLAADVDLLSGRAVAAAIRSVLNGGEAVQQFETDFRDRAALFRLARLTGSSKMPDQALLTIIVQDSELGSYPGSGASSLRDRLTGLPNRRAFEERVGEVLKHPNFIGGHHALLTVLVLDAGGEAADELVIAAAGRLLSSLRAGDLLARTGVGSFAILMRLDRGQPDAVELADRLGTVLAAPFRLSSGEVQLESRVDLAALVASA